MYSEFLNLHLNRYYDLSGKELFVEKIPLHRDAVML